MNKLMRCTGVFMISSTTIFFSVFIIVTTYNLFSINTVEIGNWFAYLSFIIGWSALITMIYFVLFEMGIIK